MSLKELIGKEEYISLTEEWAEHDPIPVNPRYAYGTQEILHKSKKPLRPSLRYVGTSFYMNLFAKH